IVEDLNAIGGDERGVRDAARARERKQFLSKREQVVGETDRFQIRIETVREPRTLGGYPGRTLVCVATHSLNAADRQKRLASDIHEVATQRKGHEGRIGESEFSGADEYHMVVQSAIGEYTLNAAEANLERQTYVIAEYQRRSAGAAFATVDRHEI